MSQFSKLNKLSHALDNNFYCINNGGCCSVAVMLADALKPYTEVRIAVSGYDGLDITEDIVNNMPYDATPRVWNENGIHFNHVFMEFKVGDEWFQYHVGKNVTRVSPYDALMRWKHRGYITLEHARNLAKSTDWNWLFDRNQIPEMQNFIECFFEIGDIYER